MRILPVLKIGIAVSAVCLCLQAQEQPGKNPLSKEVPVEIKGMPPRPTPADYPDQAEVGKVTIAVEFQGHAVPTLQGNLTTEDFVTVETAFFGPPGTRINLSSDDFTLRINGKKTLPSKPFGMVLGNVKDPEWVPTGAGRLKGASQPDRQRGREGAKAVVVGFEYRWRCE